MVTRCGQPGPSRRSGRTGPDWSDWTGLDQTGRTGPDWTRLVGLDRTGPDWTGLDQTGPDWTRLVGLDQTGPTGLTGMRTEVNVQFAEPKEPNVETTKYKKTTKITPTIQHKT